VLAGQLRADDLLDQTVHPDPRQVAVHQRVAVAGPGRLLDSGLVVRAGRGAQRPGQQPRFGRKQVERDGFGRQEGTQPQQLDPGWDHLGDLVDA
jgi:hypothetical protein